MKKFLLGLLVVIIVFVCAVFAGYCFSNLEIEDDETISTNNVAVTETVKEGNHILENGEIDSTNLFELPEETGSSYEVDLTQNDMEYSNESGFYYKIISNIEDYNTYKERLTTLPDMEEDFNEKFLVILVDDVSRDEDENSLEICEVVANDDVMNIKIKQKENSTLNIYNILYATVEISELRDVIVVSIEK